MSSEKDSVSHQSVHHQGLRLGCVSLESDLDDGGLVVVLLSLVLIILLQDLNQGLDEVPVLVPLVVSPGLAPLSGSFVPRDPVLDISRMILHNVIPLDVSPGPGLCLLDDAGGDDDQDEDNLEVGHCWMILCCCCHDVSLWMSVED